MRTKDGPQKSLSEYSRGELAMVILKFTCFSVMIAGVLVCPNLAQVYEVLDPNSRTNRRRIKRSVEELQNKGLIKRNSDDNEPLAPTSKGLRRAEYDALVIKPLGRWDGKWRLCMFDIPETDRGSRIMFGRKILELGMKPFQKSVYISPYPCEKTLSDAARYLHVEKYIKVVTATEINDKTFFKKEFGI